MGRRYISNFPFKLIDANFNTDEKSYKLIRSITARQAGIQAKVSWRDNCWQVIRKSGYLGLGDQDIWISGKEVIMAGFEKLRIWQEAHKLMLEICNVVKVLPYPERYNIGNQILRSSVSVADNISEGYSSYYYKDKIKGMYTARKEAGETQNHLRSLESKRYISKSTANILISRYEGLIKGINSWIRFIRIKMNSSP